MNITYSAFVFVVLVCQHEKHMYHFIVVCGVFEFARFFFLLQCKAIYSTRTDRKADRETNMMKLTVAYRNFTNAAKDGVITPNYVSKR
jgi:hypothetical protein